MNIILHGSTDAGCVRSQNEDAFWVDQNLGAAILADGMGGQAGGEVASRIVVETFGQILCSRLLQADSLQAVKDLLAGAFEQADQEVLAATQQDPAKCGMGATAVCACLWRSVFVIGHIGDSRAYLVRKGRISRLTMDHSIVQILINDGTIAEADARTHPQRHLITRSVDGDTKTKADLQALTAEPGDRLVLCSDGLTDVVEDQKILELVTQPQLIQAACEGLIQETRCSGAPDNVTVILMHLPYLSPT